MSRDARLIDFPLASVPTPPISISRFSSQNIHRTCSQSLDLWEYPPGEFEWQPDADVSTCVLSGFAVVDLNDDRQLHLNPGDAVYLPAGVSGRWVVHQTLRMVSVSSA